MSRANLRMINLFVMMMALAACTANEKVQDEFQQAAGQFTLAYAGTYIDSKAKGSMLITTDGKFQKTGTFQVGREGTEIPYPTTCTTVYEGYITRVYRPGALSFFETHNLNIELSAIRLDQDSPENSSLAACQKFIAKEKSKIARPLTLGVEVVSADQLRLHQSGGADYKKGEPRTASTLDENFYREAPEKFSAEL